MKITTIYAAKILGYITQRDRLVTAGEIVEHVGISYQYALKIMNEMKRAGLLESEQGCRGGYRLGNEKEDVSAYDVVALFEYRSGERDKERPMDDPFSRFMEDRRQKEAEALQAMPIREIYKGKI